jgi:hypothetical protein
MVTENGMVRVITSKIIDQSLVGGKVRRRNREIIKGLVKLINVFKLVEKKTVVVFHSVNS